MTDLVPGRFPPPGPSTGESHPTQGHPGGTPVETRLDVFLQDWSELQNTLDTFPSPQLIPQVLAMMALHKVDLILMVLGECGMVT